MPAAGERLAQYAYRLPGGGFAYRTVLLRDGAREVFTYPDDPTVPVTPVAEDPVVTAPAPISGTLTSDSPASKKGAAGKKSRFLSLSTAGGTVSLTATMTPQFPVLYIIDASGVTVASELNASNLGTITLNATLAAGTYFVELTTTANPTLTTSYTLTLEPATPENGLDGLVTAVGGDARLLGAYDSRFGVTVVSGAVSAWADARGATGFGPTLSQATVSARPTWDAATLTARANLNQSLASPAVFDPRGPLCLVYVGSFEATNPVAYALWLTVGANARYTGIMVDTGLSYGAAISMIAFNGSAAEYAGSGVLRSTTRRVMFGSKTNANASRACRVPNATPIGTSGTTGALFAEGLANLTLFHPSMVGTARAALVLDHVPTEAEITSIRDWAIAQHAAVVT